MWLRWLASLVLVAGLAGSGCAPPPSEIAAAPVPPQAYAGLNCPQLVSAQDGLNRKLAWLNTEQSQAAMDDIVGMIFTLHPLASLSGGNQQDRVALTKGELNSVNTRLARDCRG